MESQIGEGTALNPSIASDGTIYVVSLDSYLHAVNPDGTQKWSTDVGAGTSPTIGRDGTIYAGYSTLYAVNPTNGSVKWTFDVDGAIKGSTPCNSIDGTIYFGSGCWLYAVNPDGTLKWRKQIANEFIDSAPAIGEDGTVYVRAI
jgi:outer membrane protein assembly factor BamB